MGAIPQKQFHNTERLPLSHVADRAKIGTASRRFRKGLYAGPTAIDSTLSEPADLALGAWKIRAIRRATICFTAFLSDIRQLCRRQPYSV